MLACILTETTVLRVLVHTTLLLTHSHCDDRKCTIANLDEHGMVRFEVGVPHLLERGTDVLVPHSPALLRPVDRLDES
jgi:hypothetical protein